MYAQNTNARAPKVNSPKPMHANKHTKDRAKKITNKILDTILFIASVQTFAPRLDRSSVDRQDSVKELEMEIKMLFLHICVV